jgi:hypothetical protein
MKIIITIITTLLCTLCFVQTAEAQEIPDYFQGQIIAEGEKPAWLPDGSAISYVHDNQFFIYDLAQGKAKKIATMNIAEYVWLNNDSALVIEWPANVTEKKRVTKILNYWIMRLSGEKELLAADTLLTASIPRYKIPFSLPDGTVCIRKNTGWIENDLPQTDDFIAFAPAGYDIDTSLRQFRYLSYTKQERGSIHFKDINKETVKTLALGEYYFDPQLSPDQSKFLAYSQNTMVIIDTTGKILADLGTYLDETKAISFLKFYGAVWNNSSKGFVYVEIYANPDKYYTINFFDLALSKKESLTQTFYYGKDSFKFSADDKTIIAHLNFNDKDLIAILKL